MKRIRSLLGLFIFIVIASVVVVAFELPERIDYLVNGMGAFDSENYKVTEEPINTECKIAVSIESFGKNDRVVYESINGLKLLQSEMTFDGYAYTMKITSIGKGTFDGGQILVLGSDADKYYETDLGTIVFQKMWSNEIVSNSISYRYAVYPLRDISLEEIAKLNITVIIDGISIKTFQKK